MKNEKGITLIALILIILLLLVLAGITVALVVANENVDEDIITPQTEYRIEEKQDVPEELPSELPGAVTEPIPGEVVEDTNTVVEDTNTTPVANEVAAN